MAFAKLAQSTDNKQMTGAGGGMTGTASGGATGGNQSTSGSQGAFTNIQDYIGANTGDKTNQNYLNNAADTQISNAANQVQSNINAAPAITQNPAPSADLLNANTQNDFRGNKYLSGNLDAYTKAPTPYNMPSLGSNPTAGLQDNLSSVLNYMGGSSVKPLSQNYTQGMQKFDEMLLGNDPQFSKDFASNKQQQYKTQVEDPYGAFTTARSKQQADAENNANDWSSAINNYKTDLEKSNVEVPKQLATGDATVANPKTGASPLGNQAFNVGQTPKLPMGLNPIGAGENQPKGLTPTNENLSITKPKSGVAGAAYQGMQNIQNYLKGAVKNMPKGA